MYYPLRSSLILFFLFSLFYHLPCAASKCESLFQCGNITAGFPFWGGNRHKHCGHPLLELRCNQYNSTTLFISDQVYYVLHVDQTSYNLTLARNLFDFFCSFTFTNTTLPPEIFEISSTYKSVTFYHHCNPYLPYLSNYTCPGIDPPITVSGNPEYHASCLASFTTNVPKSFVLEEKELNMSNLESVLRKGFDVKVKVDEKACQECLSSHGFCSFNETFPYEFECIPRHRPNARSQQIMYYLPTSCLFLFFLFSSFHPLPYASSKQEELGWCEAKFQCGNITAGFPFSGGIRPQICGHPSLELHCFNNKTSIIISDHLYNVFHIDQTSKTLRLARAELEGSFCNATYTATTLPSKIFEISPTYKSLTVFYLCDRKLAYLSSYTCPGRGPVVVSQNLDHHDSCQGSFTINVPNNFIPEEKELNLAHLEKALKEGFEVKVKIDEKACQKCSSSGGICGFENSTQICCKQASSSGCNKLHPLLDATEPELHRRCVGPFSCGDQSELFYPFWKSGREDCGHPDFKLDDCSGRFAELSISSVKFRILEANYVSGIIRLARLDYISNLCPQNPPNAPFNENVLPFTPDTELLTIYYDCPESSISTYFGELDCDGGDGVDRKNYYVTRNLSSPLLSGVNDLLSNFRRLCQRYVSIPASGSALDALQNLPTEDNLKNALKEGFQLQLNQDCPMCMESGGACGYDQTRTSSGFVCYCIDKSSNHTCGSKKKGLSTGEKAGIAAGAFVLGLAILIVAGVFLCIRRRRKTQDAEYTSKSLPITSYSSRETSRNPTSTTISSSSNHSLLPSISNLANGSDYYGVQVFSYEELEEATENFSRELGDGGFGTVYYGVLKDGRAVAVKRLYERSLKRVEQFKNEIEILKSLKHPNLVILYGCTSRHSRELLLVYEYISNGTLAEHLHGHRAEARPLCWSTRLNIAIETASALYYLHKSEAVDITRHRHDINLANMAVSKIQNNALHELVDSSLGFDNDPEVRRKMMSVAELAFRCLQQEREVRPSMDEIVEILRGVKEEEKSPDVVDIECGGDDVGLLRNSVPPPISPETDKWTSSSDTAASL
ncbi:unnamed protein product [Arabidopsis arenosa]|uniref:non-specific serine/threonine protein kinase n=1 Tax=Arabidopsis arenosa TaxID=38785 RepID=A0A8S1ZUP1_ARAAE|nr:unnamed protein product [Arabidopsis arenosa]